MCKDQVVRNKMFNGIAKNTPDYEFECKYLVAKQQQQQTTF